VNLKAPNKGRGRLKGRAKTTQSGNDPRGSPIHIREAGGGETDLIWPEQAWTGLLYFRGGITDGKRTSIG